MNEHVKVIQTALFTLDYNYWVVHVLAAFLQSIVHICWNWSAFVTTLCCKQPSRWPLLRKKVIPMCTLLEFLHSSRGKFSKIVSKCFFQVFNGFKYILCFFLKKLHFWLMSSFFILSGNLSRRNRRNRNIFWVSLEWVPRLAVFTCAVNATSNFCCLHACFSNEEIAKSQYQ